MLNGATAAPALPMVSVPIFIGAVLSDVAVPRPAWGRGLGVHRAMGAWMGIEENLGGPRGDDRPIAFATAVWREETTWGGKTERVMNPAPRPGANKEVYIHDPDVAGESGLRPVRGDVQGDFLSPRARYIALFTDTYETMFDCTGLPLRLEAGGKPLVLRLTVRWSVAVPQAFLGAFCYAVSPGAPLMKKRVENWVACLISWKVCTAIEGRAPQDLWRENLCQRLEPALNDSLASRGIRAHVMDCAPRDDAEHPADRRQMAAEIRQAWLEEVRTCPGLTDRERRHRTARYTALSDEEVVEACSPQGPGESPPVRPRAAGPLTRPGRGPRIPATPLQIVATYAALGPLYFVFLVSSPAMVLVAWQLKRLRVWVGRGMGSFFIVPGALVSFLLWVVQFPWGVLSLFWPVCAYGPERIWDPRSYWFSGEVARRALNIGAEEGVSLGGENGTWAGVRKGVTGVCTRWADAVLSLGAAPADQIGGLDFAVSQEDADRGVERPNVGLAPGMMAKPMVARAGLWVLAGLLWAGLAAAAVVLWPYMVMAIDCCR